MFRESYEHIIHYYVRICRAGFLPANWWQQVGNLLSEQNGRFGNLPYSQRDFQSQLQRANAPEY